MRLWASACGALGYPGVAGRAPVSFGGVLACVVSYIYRYVMYGGLLPVDARCSIGRPLSYWLLYSVLWPISVSPVPHMIVVLLVPENVSRAGRMGAGKRGRRGQRKTTTTKTTRSHGEDACQIHKTKLKSPPHTPHHLVQDHAPTLYNFTMINSCCPDRDTRRNNT